MKVRPILNLLGIGLVYFSFFQLLPIAISLIYEENNFTDYSGAFFITLITGIAFWVATYKEKQETIRKTTGTSTKKIFLSGPYFLFEMFLFNK